MRRLSGAIAGRHPPRRHGPFRVGVLPGEGVGPEVTGAAAAVLGALASRRGLPLELVPGPGGAESAEGGALSEAAADFCRDTFAAGGAILAGAHGGRWVYELRGRLDLFCKLSPVRPPAELSPARSAIAPAALDGVDLLIVREQSGGAYQGRWGTSEGGREGPVAEHSFSYDRRQVRRIVEVGAALARGRDGRLAVVVKDGGIPSVSALWRECAAAVSGNGVEVELIDIDYAAYRLVREPAGFDVIVAPNLFGDVLSDAAGALLGSRGNSFGGSFDDAAAAVYQTNHGAAHDLAGSDRANPIGQILSAAMMLRESFDLVEEAELIEAAVSTAWRRRWRTDDLAEAGCRVAGTREMAERVCECLEVADAEGRAVIGRDPG